MRHLMPQSASRRDGDVLRRHSVSSRSLPSRLDWLPPRPHLLSLIIMSSSWCNACLTRWLTPVQKPIAARYATDAEHVVFHARYPLNLQHRLGKGGTLWSNKYRIQHHRTSPFESSTWTSSPLLVPLIPCSSILCASPDLANNRSTSSSSSPLVSGKKK